MEAAQGSMLALHDVTAKQFAALAGAVMDVKRARAGADAAAEGVAAAAVGGRGGGEEEDQAAAAAARRRGVVAAALETAAALVGRRQCRCPSRSSTTQLHSELIGQCPTTNHASRFTQIPSCTMRSVCSKL